MILDDPQELLDDDNRDRLARTLPELVGIGANLILDDAQPVVRTNGSGRGP